MKPWLVLFLLATCTIGVSTLPVPPHRLNKLGSKNSELNDPVAQAAVGNTDGRACTLAGAAIKCSGLE
ncbi:hypothetical protein RSOLAG1IB_04176 [Rhizoctonia solani AG-1 IB]|uniref:Uncharacterized protein n=1 Tax=Thanatephorus cucumeris (strain AG1-IB / isolate 7/3/14) TaxID=1108050 RepID=A0A0B7FXL0_THACB|nr:hypothetical protein RSOLAG1IB_04176 [Rhizoctonia solani AG-1 IB]